MPDEEAPRDPMPEMPAVVDIVPAVAVDAELPDTFTNVHARMDPRERHDQRYQLVSFCAGKPTRIHRLLSV